MRITEIRIENFKGIRDPATVTLRPVTLLFGANSAGKSTIVQALQYMHELLERHNVDPGRTLVGGEAIELGGFESLVHGQDRRRVIKLRLTMDIDSAEELPAYRLPYVTSHSDIEVWPYAGLHSAWVELHVAWSDLLPGPFLARYEIGLNGVPFAEIDGSNPRNIELDRIALMHPAFVSVEPGEGPRMELASLALNVLRDEFCDTASGTVRFGLLGQADAVPTFGRPFEVQDVAFIEGANPR